MSKNNFITKDGHNAFFADMDYSNSQNGCLSGRLILLCFVIIVVMFIISGAIILLILNIKVNKSFSKIEIPLVTQLLNGNEPTKDNYTVTITDSQLTEILRSLNIPDVKNIKTTTTKEHILITGIYQKPLDLNLEVRILPKVKDKKVVIEVQDATVGGIRMIWLITDNMRQSIAGGIENYATGRINGKITDVVLKAGETAVKVSN